MALINTSILPQKFEAVRDAIAAILATELANQYAIDNTYPNITKIWVERCIMFQSDEVPTVNVNIDRGDYLNKTQVDVQGTYLFNVDVYTQSDSTADISGDQASMLLMSKILGMCRYILSAPPYNKLGFTDNTVRNTMVNWIRVVEKAAIQDALSNVVGRLQFSVSVNEYVNGGQGVPLNIYTSVSKLGSTEKGFFYSHTDS
jgi:hypothetical protein